MVIIVGKSDFIPNHRRNKPVAEFVDNNLALDRKIKLACQGLMPNAQWTLMELPRDEDKELIADFILNYANESNDGMPMAPNTKRSYIDALVYLARHHGHKKSFNQMTKEDIVDGYLASLKKSFDQDIEQRWVNSYNTRGSKYLAFWKWLTQPDLKREERQTPPQMKGWRVAKRKSKTHIKRDDFWTAEEHRVFLKYCEDLRLACFHAIHRDTGGRPSELLALKISDLQIKTSPSTGKKYAEFWIGDKLGGKSKKARPVSISDAIPYLNVWVAVHPRRDSPQGAYLFPSREKRAMYRNVPLKEDSLRLAYTRTIEKQFPKLLDRPDIPLEDKIALKSLIYDKPHYPYVRRHEFASEWAPRLSPMAFNQLMGHSPMSRMREVYVQELGDEGNKELQIARGLISREETITPAELQLKPKYCPICHETNKQEADFCFKCNWVISKKGMEQVKEKDEAAAKEAENLKKELDEIKSRQRKRDEEIAAATAALNEKIDRIEAERKGIKDDLIEEFRRSLQDHDFFSSSSNVMKTLQVSESILSRAYPKLYRKITAASSSSSLLPKSQTSQ